VNEALSIAAAAREVPQAIGLRTGERAYTFAELARLTARKLHEMALDATSRPFVLDGTNSLDTVITLYALLEQQRPAVLLHPKLNAPEREAALHASAKGEASLLAGAAVIVFTSGTTGEPRAAVLTGSALLASAAASAANLGWHDDDCWLLAMPIARIGGLSILTRCLAARRTVALTGFDPAKLPQLFDRHRVTLASLVPTMLARVLDAHPQWRPPTRLRAVLIGGAAAPPRLLERAAARGVPVVITYGCTETCSQVVATPYALRFDAARCGAGRPLPGAEVRVEKGRIEVRGAMMMAGYAGEPQLEPQQWFDTGDLGAFDAEGFLHFSGRSGDLIITGGENVHPAEVERVLEEFPGIDAAAVFGVPDDTWGQVIAAALVVEREAPADRPLADFLASRLAPYKLPRRIAIVDALPQTSSGKLDRCALAQLADATRAVAVGRSTPH